MRAHPILVLAIGLLLAACADRTDPSGDGTLVVSTSTLVGGDPDQDGYLLTVDGLDSLHLDPTGTSNVAVPSGQHTLGLLGVAEHCSVTPGTSLQVDVPSGGSSSVAFIVSCPVARITTKTSGLDIDGSYRLLVNGTDGGVIGSNDTVLTRLDPGSWTFTLVDLAPNCTASGPASRQVTVTSLQVIPIEFSVSCTATSGVIGVVVRRSGPVATGDMFEASLDGAEALAVGLGVPLYMNAVSTGDHVISLLGSPNCSVVDPGSKPVTMAVGKLVRDTVNVEFSVTCTLPPGTSGTVRITVPTSGPLPGTTPYTVCYYHTDPWGYSRVSDTTGAGTCTLLGFSFLDSLAPNGTLVTELTASSSNPNYYWYDFELTGVPANCSVQKPIPDRGTHFFQIPLGGTLDLEFAVTCSAVDPGWSLGRPRSQLAPVHLPQMRDRESLDEDHLTRALVMLEPLVHERLELRRQPVAALARDDPGARLDQSVGVGHTHHRDLRHRRMQQQTTLHLSSRKPFA